MSINIKELQMNKMFLNAMKNNGIELPQKTMSRKSLSDIRENFRKTHRNLLKSVIDLPSPDTPEFTLPGKEKLNIGLIDYLKLLTNIDYSKNLKKINDRYSSYINHLLSAYMILYKNYTFALGLLLMSSASIYKLNTGTNTDTNTSKRPDIAKYLGGILILYYIISPVFIYMLYKMFFKIGDVNLL